MKKLFTLRLFEVHFPESPDFRFRSNEEGPQKKMADSAGEISAEPWASFKMETCLARSSTETTTFVYMTYSLQNGVVLVFELQPFFSAIKI